MLKWVLFLTPWLDPSFKPRNRNWAVKPISQILENTHSISHNAPFRTELCTSLFRWKHLGVWNRCILEYNHVHISVLNGALRGMEQVHFGICESGQLTLYVLIPFRKYCYVFALCTSYRNWDIPVLNLPSRTHGTQPFQFINNIAAGVHVRGYL